MEKFNAEKFFRRVVWVIIAICVGVGSVASTIDWDTFPWTWAAVCSLGYAVARAAVGWLVKSGKIPEVIGKLL